MLSGDRRAHERSESRDRRAFPRPPLWLNLAILLLAVAVGVTAKLHRRSLNERFARAMSAEASPVEVDQIKEQLSQMDLNQDALRQELESRLKMLGNLETEQFYIAINTKEKTLDLHYGVDVVRRAPVQIGEPKVVKLSADKTITFAQLKGGFAVESKDTDITWRVPEWVYAMNGQTIPAERPAIKDGLGKYVIFLHDNYIIHSPPSPDSPLQGPKPGSFMVPEEDLRAIWPRINKGTIVYVF